VSFVAFFLAFSPKETLFFCATFLRRTVQNLTNIHHNLEFILSLDLYWFYVTAVAEIRGFTFPKHFCRTPFRKLKDEGWVDTCKATGSHPVTFGFVQKMAIRPSNISYMKTERVYKWKMFQVRFRISTFPPPTSWLSCYISASYSGGSWFKFRY
jgi:hypothetical protein